MASSVCSIILCSFYSVYIFRLSLDFLILFVCTFIFFSLVILSYLCVRLFVLVLVFVTVESREAL